MAGGGSLAVGAADGRGAAPAGDAVRGWEAGDATAAAAAAAAATAAAAGVPSFDYILGAGPAISRTRGRQLREDFMGGGVGDPTAVLGRDSDG
ncbi:hypothetical protein I4F81_007249 [Pyropia yezoensis]|uniref:Uncharacterized protein n=1 Tax=Pyropia yezoensis TaxID=2788 RepID=A0ACC3C3C2_PYRYE|nr:hypothetical protein I4F81_007249 [Neopyropia yezoensis]